MEPVIVEKILDTKNPNIKTLQLRTEITQFGSDAYFMKGIFNNIEKRVAFRTVSAQFLIDNDIKVGTDLTTKGECKLVIKESFEPQITADKDGVVIWEQKPKINNTTKEEILVDGKKVYRNCEFTTDIHEQDVYIKAVKNTVKVKAEATIAA